MLYPKYIQIIFRAKKAVVMLVYNLVMRVELLVKAGGASTRVRVPYLTWEMEGINSRIPSLEYELRTPL